MRHLLCTALLGIVVIVAALAGGNSPATASASIGYLPPGWANPGDCGLNSVILFRLRGSGESYGSDRLGAWTAAAGTRAIQLGWSVRDIQAKFTAPNVPMSSIAIAVGGILVGRPDVSAAGLLGAKRYRDVATAEAPGARVQLVALHSYCPQAKILVAGYSFGNIILRTILPDAPPGVRNSIVSADLVADPTADDKVDGGLAVAPRSLDGAVLSGPGLDTVVARRPNPFFKQKTYPSGLKSRAYPYCKSDDVVCHVPVTPAALKREGTTHASYKWSGIGTEAANRLGTAPAPPKPLDCNITAAKSIRGDTRSEISFVNSSGVTLDIYWLNYVGARVFYYTLSAGKSYLQRTWLTHPWVAVDRSGVCHGFTLSDTLSKTYVIP